MQFIPRTALNYGPSNPFDAKANIVAGARLWIDNRRCRERALKRLPSNGEVYLGHMQGGGGAARLLSRPKALAHKIVGRKAVLLGIGGTLNVSAGEFAKFWTRRFE